MMEEIEHQNVHENFESALEHNPEAFSSVCLRLVCGYRSVWVSVGVWGVCVGGWGGEGQCALSPVCGQRAHLSSHASTRCSPPHP